MNTQTIKNTSPTLFKKFLSGGFLGVLRLGVGFVRVKFLALMVGIAGVGLMAQANQFYLFSLSVITLSMAAGIINRIRAPGRLNNRHLQAQTQGTALVTILALIFIFLIIVIIFQNSIINQAFRGSLSFKQFIPALIGLPFAAIASGYFEGIYFSRDRYDLYIKSSAWASIIEIFSYITLVSLYGLQGALVALGLSGIILFVSFSIHLKKLNEKLTTLISFHFNWTELYEILKYCVAVISGAGVGYFVILWLRGDVLQFLGPSGNGLLQPALALSAYTLPLITNGIWGHLHPEGSKSGDTSAARVELSKVLLMVLFLSAGASITLLTFCDTIIWLAFSKEFVQSRILFPYQFTADFFYHIFYVLSVYFLSTSRLKNYIFLWLTYFSILFFSVKILMPLLGITAYSLGHFISSFTMGGFALLWMIRLNAVSKKIAWHFFILLSLVTLCALAHYSNTNFYLKNSIWLVGVFYILFNLRRGDN